jgi:hypothetical protein
VALTLFDLAGAESLDEAWSPCARLGTQSFLGGKAPNYADYVVFGGFMWARSTSPFRLVETAIPLHPGVTECLIVST